MDATGVALFLGLLALTGAGLTWMLGARKRVERRTASWLISEAVVQTGELVSIDPSQYHPFPSYLPVFTFTYQVGSEYFGGRFALYGYLTAPDASITTRLVGLKLQVRYQPSHPEVWFLPQELIEGCRIAQELGPHSIASFNPRVCALPSVAPVFPTHEAPVPASTPPDRD